MSDRLKVCKRCGTYASVQEITDTRGERLFYRVRCDNPICDEVSRLHKTIDEAVAEWNDPTTKDALRAELAAKDAEIDRLQTWLDEAQSACKGLGQTADNFGARLNAARAEVERLRGIIRGAENIQQEWARQSIRVCCDSRPGDEHEPDCPFYQWEGTE